MSCFTEQLLEVVYNHPILYDSNHKDHKYSSKKNNIWNSIGEELNVSGDDVKKKWKNLRDTYAKHLKTTKLSDQEHSKYKIWKWAPEMEKYRPFVAVTTTNSCYHQTKREVVEEAESSAEEYPAQDDVADVHFELINNDYQDQSVVNTFRQLNSARIRNSAKKPKLNSSVYNADDVAGYLEHSKLNEFDAIDFLMLGYAKTIKQFSPQRQAVTKLELAQIIMRKEIEQIQENQSR